MNRIARGVSFRHEISLFGGQRSGRAMRPPFPWFVIGLVAFVGLVVIPVDARKAIPTLTILLQSTQALGLASDTSRTLRELNPPGYTGRIGISVYRDLQLHTRESDRMIRS
jgi:hypothetical protein